MEPLLCFVQPLGDETNYEVGETYNSTEGSQDFFVCRSFLECFVNDERRKPHTNLEEVQPYFVKRGHPDILENPKMPEEKCFQVCARGETKKYFFSTVTIMKIKTKKEALKTTNIEQCFDLLRKKDILRKIPKEITFRFTRELFLEDCKARGTNFHLFPIRMVTEQMCKEVIKHDDGKEFPSNLISVLKKTNFNKEFLKGISGRNMTKEEFFNEVVKIYPVALVSIPEKYVDLKMCLGAVKKNGGILKHVPLKFKTPHLCFVAVENLGSVLKHVPENVVDEEMCVAAVSQSEIFHSFVPEHLKSSKSIIRAIKKINPKFFDDETVFFEPFTSDQEKDKKPNLSLFPEAKFENHFLKIDPQKIEQSDCNKAVSEKPKLIQFVPEKFVSEGMCYFAVEKDPSSLLFIPPKFKTPELCLMAIKIDYRALGFVPNEVINEEMCSIAFEQNAESVALMQNALERC